jgi:hypothetical protein
MPVEVVAKLSVIPKKPVSVDAKVPAMIFVGVCAPEVVIKPETAIWFAE